MSYRIRLHPGVSADLDAIVQWLVDYAGVRAAERKLADIEDVIEGLKLVPHKGSIRNEIAPGLRAVPAGRKATIVFTVDDDAREVLVHAVTYAGADWIARSMARRL